MFEVVELSTDETVDETSASRADFLVWNAGGSRAPLVLIRTWAEEIPRHQRLARALGTDQPLYSMGHPVGSRAEDYPEHADQWADFCLARHEKLGLAGPVRIGGWSFGGVIALEVARRLAARGHEVERVVMLDSRIPKRKPTRETRGWMKLGTTLQEYALCHTPEERRAWLRARVQRRTERTWGKVRSIPEKLRLRRQPLQAGEMRPSRLRPLDRLTRAIRVCYLKYQPEASDLPAAQLWTQGSRDHVRGDVTLGWSELLHGELRIAPVSGDHYSMFDDEHVTVLARHLEGILAGD